MYSKYLLSVLFSISLLLIGFCSNDNGVSPNTDTTSGTISRTITYDGLKRTYFLHIPASYTGDESMPLVFNFHGYAQFVSFYIDYADFRAVAENAGFFVVYPQGTLDDRKYTYWNAGDRSKPADRGFTEALLNSIASEYNIDLKRVYAAGFSNGGFFSYYLAGQLSDKFAAIASVTGSMRPYKLYSYEPQHPMPVMQIHGTNDKAVPYNGGNSTLGIDEVIQYWVDRNNCNPTAKTTAIPDIEPADSSTVEHIVYDGGDCGVTVELFKIIGGGHAWPGKLPKIPGDRSTNYDINASLEIWKFFSKYDINGPVD